MTTCLALLTRSLAGGFVSLRSFSVFCILFVAVLRGAPEGEAEGKNLYFLLLFL